LKKVASEAEARKNEAKKRSLHRVNEHFEPSFDDASASAVVFQRAAMSLSDLDINLLQIRKIKARFSKSDRLL